jgi:hypothetical protein
MGQVLPHGLSAEGRPKMISGMSDHRDTTVDLEIANMAIRWDLFLFPRGRVWWRNNASGGLGVGSPSQRVMRC